MNLDREKIVHELALIYVKAKYEKFLTSTSSENCTFQRDVNELADLYTHAVSLLISHIDEIEAAYKDDDGIPIL